MKVRGRFCGARCRLQIQSVPCSAPCFPIIPRCCGSLGVGVCVCMCMCVCVCVRTGERSVFSVKRRRVGTVRLSGCFREPEQRRAEPVRILRATDRHLIRAEAGGRWSRLGWLRGAARSGAAGDVRTQWERTRWHRAGRSGGTLLMCRGAGDGHTGALRVSSREEAAGASLNPLG